MTAYGAVISLKNTIHYILHSSHFSLVEPSPTIIQAAYKDLQPLQNILRKLDKTRTSRSRKKVNEVDGRIKQKIWEFEDKLESLLYQQILPQFPAAEQVDGDGDGGIKETTVWPFQGSLIESSHIPSESQTLFQIPPPDGGIKERTVGQFQALLESIPSKFEFQSPPPQQVELTTRRRKVVHKHKSGRTPTRRRSRDPLLFSIDLQCLQDDVASFIHALKEMEKEYIYELENMPQEPIATTIGFHFGGPKSKMIGLSDQFQKIKDDLMGFEESDMILSRQIVGMAGIGKTTIAKELYEDPEIVSRYECRAWITVTRTMVEKGPQFDEAVKGIVAQLCDGDTLIQGDKKRVRRYLKGKKCLIVLDDVWEEQVLHCLRKSLPDIRNGVLYILVTTRGASLSAHCTEARFLNEEESKELLCHRVFGGKELCPDQLDNASAKIAKKCEGLPLMIVTVADILSKSENTEPDYWNEVAEERNSVFKDAYNEISEVLFPSYDYLPQHLKMPFLFMGVFPPDYEIPPYKLMNMLNGEDWFFDPNKKESLESSVWVCLDQLCIRRYLVLFKNKSVFWNIVGIVSNYKTFWLHSSWRYVCRREARKNKLYLALHKLVDMSEEEDIKGQRGLCLQNNILFGIKDFCESVRLHCAASTRSLLFFGPYHQYPTPIDVGFRLLRELDALQLRFYTFPIEILTLVQLKYLALTCNGELPTTISTLFNLQVLIIHPHMNIRRGRAPSYVPIQIWDMQELEHIEILGQSLRVSNHVASLEKLSTLLGVNASICTIFQLSRRIPNIKKLGVRIELTPYDDHNDILSCFACMSTLEGLETLKCSIINPVIKYMDPAPPTRLMLPLGLRKLHLSGTSFPWEYIDVIGSLQNLQVLKLRSYAFRGPNWEEPQERRFRALRFLLIEDSDLVSLNIPCRLANVCIKHCYKLKRIHWPSGFEDRKIELVDCNPLAYTWAKELKPHGFSFVDVSISSSFEEKPMMINLVRHWKDTIDPESSCTDDEDPDEDDDDDDDLADKGEDEKGHKEIFIDEDEKRENFGGIWKSQRNARLSRVAYMFSRSKSF